MVNGIGSIGSIGRQVYFGTTREELNQKLNLNPSSPQAAPAAAAPVGAQSVDSEAPTKSHKGLYITLGAVVVAAVVAGLGHYKKLPDFAQKHYETLENKVIDGWKWLKGKCSKAEKEAAKTEAPKPEVKPEATAAATEATAPAEKAAS